MTTKATPGELGANDELGRSLCDLISDYGMARTDGASDVDRFHRWQKLVSGIKQYAAQKVAVEREKCADVCESEAAMWEADGRGIAAEARLCAARIRARPNGSVEPGTTVRRCDSARTRG